MLKLIRLIYLYENIIKIKKFYYWIIAINLKICLDYLSSCDLEYVVSKLVFGGICSVMVTLGYANYCDQVDKMKQHQEQVAKVTVDTDVDLRKDYHQLKQWLNSTQKKILKKSQFAWEYYRDEECIDEQQNSLNMQCSAKMAKKRRKWLQQRLHECQTDGCSTIRLSK